VLSRGVRAHAIQIVLRNRDGTPGRLATALLFCFTNCFAAMLDRNAARCFRRERGFHHGFYEGSNFRFIIHRYSFVDCTPSDKRAGQRHPEKQ
jgi:hypothetical protein